MKCRQFGYGLVLATFFSPVGVPAAPAVAPGHEVLTIVPDDPAGGRRAEVVLSVRDLRGYHRWASHARDIARLSKLGARFYDPAYQQEAFGFDLLGEVARLAELAAPGGAPVPAGLAVVATPTGPGVELYVKVGEGFVRRLAAAMASTSPPPWPVRVDGELVRFEAGPVTGMGSVGGDGWLRLSTAPGDGSPGPATPLLEGTMRKWTDDCEFILVARGGGMLAEMLATGASGPVEREVLGGLRALVIGGAFDGDRTHSVRVLVDHPLLVQVGPTVRRPDLANELERLWNADTTSFASLSLPPALVGALPMLLGRAAEDHPGIAPPELLGAAQRLEGRVGWVHFGAPGDWALGVQMMDATSATGLVAAVQPWLTGLAQGAGDDAARLLARETHAQPVGAAVLVRPSPLLDGVRIAAVDKTVLVVGQRARLERLARHHQAGHAKGVQSGPLTSPIREALADPAILTTYSVLGGDPTMFEALSWLGGGIAAFIRTLPLPPEVGVLGKYLRELPNQMALAGFVLMMTYDVMVSVDVENSVLVVNALSSEI